MENEEMESYRSQIKGKLEKNERNSKKKRREIEEIRKRNKKWR